MVSKIAVSVLVRNCPCLYDGTDPEYGDKRKTDASWQAIASVLNTSVAEAQKQWSRCCEIYYKYRNNTKTHLFDEQTKKLIEQMQFIEPYLVNSSFSGTNNNPTTSRRSDNFRNSTFDNSDDNISPHRKNQKLAAVSLIKLVQEHPVLYDANHVHYRNKKKTEEAWNAIANILGVTVAQCSSRWSYLRKSFRKYVKSTTSVNKSKYQRTHPYAKELKFLIPVLAQRVIDDTCKDQRRQIQNGESLEVIEISVSSDDDDIEDEIDESDETTTQNEGSNYEVDSTVNDDGKAEKRSREGLHCSSSKKIKGNTSNAEIEIDQQGTTCAFENGNYTALGVEEGEVGNIENERQVDVKNGKMEFTGRTSSDIPYLENDPDMLFFRSLLPELHLMTSQQKNKFRLAVLTSIDDILNHQYI